MTTEYVDSYIGKIDFSTPTTTLLIKLENSKFKCKYDQSENANDCLIYDKSTELTEPKNKDWDISSFKKVIGLPSLNNHLIIQLSDYKSITDIQNKKIEISDSYDEEKISFDIIAPLNVNIDELNNINGAPIILA